MIFYEYDRAARAKLHGLPDFYCLPQIATLTKTAIFLKKQISPCPGQGDMQKGK